MKKTSFLPGFHQLFGRAKKSQLDALVALRDRIRKEGVGQLPTVFGDVIEAESLKLDGNYQRRLLIRWEYKVENYLVFLQLDARYCCLIVYEISSRIETSYVPSGPYGWEVMHVSPQTPMALNRWINELNEQ